VPRLPEGCLAEHSLSLPYGGGGASVEASGPQQSNNRMEVSICADLLAGRLETCGCQVADGIASRGAVLFPGYHWLHSLWEPLLRLHSSRELIRLSSSLLMGLFMWKT